MEFSSHESSVAPGVVPYIFVNLFSETDGVGDVSGKTGTQATVLHDADRVSMSG